MNCQDQSNRSKYVFFAFILLINISLVFHVNANPIIKKIEQVKSELGARVGVSVYDVSSKQLWDYDGDVRFPLMSTFKTLACAKLLADVDKGKNSLETSVVVKQSSLLHYSPVTENYVGKKFTLRQACSAAMLMSDNTAANIVLENIGGPKGLTDFMNAIGDDITRLDRIEPSLNEALDGDLRDTTTPNAIVKSLNEILFGSALSQKSKSQ